MYLELAGRLIVVSFAIFSAVVVGVKSLFKKHKKGEEVTANDVEKEWLKIKEVATEAIYSQEENYKSMKAQGIKCGSFKLDSVLKTVDNYCLRNGFDFNCEKVTTFVKEQVEKMKGVK